MAQRTANPKCSKWNSSRLESHGACLRDGLLDNPPSRRPGRDFQRGDPMRFCTIAKVAEWLQVSPRTVHRWIKSGALIVHRVDGVVRIAEGDLRAFLSSHRDS